jgi:hypothetical protein
MGRFFMLLLLSSMAADAWAWRCNGWIIEEGQTQFDVGQKCGDPESGDRRTEWRVITNFVPNCQTQWTQASMPDGRGGQRVQNQPRTVCVSVPVQSSVPVEVEEWYYSDAGRGNVPKLLHFVNGRLAFIETLWNQRNLR